MIHPLRQLTAFDTHLNGKRPRTLITKYGDQKHIKQEIRENPFKAENFEKYLMFYFLIPCGILYDGDKLKFLILAKE